MALIADPRFSPSSPPPWRWWAWENRRRRRHPVPEGHQPDVEISHEQEFELYHNALSLCSMKSRVCMAELGIPYGATTSI